jgi:hypothetical protein
MSDRPAPRTSLAEIKALLQAQVASLAAQLAPDGTRSGKYWIAKNPTRKDDNAGSFIVWLHGGAPGSWKDLAGDCKRGGADTGDVLDFISYCNQYGDLKRDKEAMRLTIAWARDWLGLEKMPDEQRRKTVAAVQARCDAENKNAAERLAKDRNRALALFIRSRAQPFLGSPADRYLQSRGIEIARLGRMPGALGWLPEARHIETGTVWPVMVAGFTCPQTRKIIAVHRTFLAHDGSDKAPLGRDAKGRKYPAKKIWPMGWKGAAIRLWRGGSKLSVEDAAKHGLREKLVETEGIENGLSIAIACPELRVWVAGAINNLGAMVVPECVDELIVAADNDYGKPQAQRALDEAIAEQDRVLLPRGVTVSLARSALGKDANDALKCMPGRG